MTWLAGGAGGPVVALLHPHQGVAMHCIIAALYGAIIWLATLAYLLILGGPVLGVALLGPVLVSGLTVALLVLDLALDPLWPVVARRWAWLSSSTVRLWARWRPARGRTARE